MSLRPFANLFAARSEDPALLARLAANLRECGEFAEVWHPAPHWVAAAAPLPESDPDTRLERELGLAFAEGRDNFPGEDLRRVREIASRSPEKLSTLPGDFSFLHFDAAGTATVVRSCAGLVPFYLHQADNLTAISTRLGSVVRLVPGDFPLDPLVCGVWTTGHGFFPDNRTFFRGISILQAGHFARIESGELAAPVAYWQPRPTLLQRPTEETTREHAERLRTLLIANLSRDLDPAGRNLLTLSGGADSSSLAYLAVNAVGRKIMTLSFIPDRQPMLDEEMSYLQPLRDTLRIDQSWAFPITPDSLMEWAREAPPIAFPVLHPALCVLPRIVRERPVRVLFGGEFADEICGSAITMPDWLRHTSPWRMLREIRALPNGPKDLLRWCKHRGLRALGRSMLRLPKVLPDFIRPEVREEYAAWLRRRQRIAASDRAPLPYLGCNVEAGGWLTMNWEACGELGIRRSLPFLTREMLELAFACHPGELLGPGTKKLLRAALATDVPLRHLGRGKNPWPASPEQAQEDFARDRSTLSLLTPVLRDDWLTRPTRPVSRRQAIALTRLTGLLYPTYGVADANAEGD